MIFYYYFLNSKKALQKNEKIIYLENINRLYIAKISPEGIRGLFYEQDGTTGTVPLVTFPVVTFML